MLYGKTFRLEIPETWRPSVYGAFSSIFSVNLSEIKKPLHEYQNLNEFFTRELKDGARKIDSGALVSPCDAKVATIGVVGKTLDSIKGSDYDFTLFLTGANDFTYETYRKSLKQNTENELYYITLYLAPGDYHRFHSPADWEIAYRRHLFGYLCGVFSWNLWRKKTIFTINERVAYFGRWKYGALHYVAVAAFNVGDIKVKCDPELVTNVNNFTGPTVKFDQKELKYKASKGEEFGAFNAGSTIVMIFEGPKNMKWKVQPGDRVQVGNQIIDLE